MDFPLTPMPGNIKSFDQILIRFGIFIFVKPIKISSHFDPQIHGFLRQIRPILMNVKLELYHTSPTHMEHFRVVLTNLLPLLSGIRSLKFNVPALPTVQQCIGNDELANTKELKIFSIETRGMDDATVTSTVSFLMNWLITPGQASNGPRLCEVSVYYDDKFLNRIYTTIRQVDFETF